MKRPGDSTTRVVPEREYLGALVLALERRGVNSSSLGELRPSDFVSPHAAATFQEIARVAALEQTLDRYQLVAALVTNHGASHRDALAYVNALIADAPVQPHLSERARRVRDAARRDTPGSKQCRCR